MKYLEHFSIVVYALVGLISLIMAYKSITSKKFILFQQKAAVVPWENIDSRLQFVIIALMRISGLGFLIVAILLLLFPIINYFKQDEFIRYSIPLISLLFCLGLLWINYYLHKQTKSATPWIGSLFTSILIVVGLILSLV
jgi:hypothetical protein